MAGMFDTSLTSPGTTAHRGGRGVRLAARALVGTAVAAAFLSASTLSASAAPGETAEDTVIANVGVDSTITLELDQTSFDLEGTPDSTVVGPAAVTGVVTTNSSTGYTVEVQAAAAALVAQTAGNTDSIPIGALEVTDDADEYAPVSDSAPVTTVTTASRSAVAGDAFSDDYQVTIPSVFSDTYSVTLNYTATALA